VSGNSQSLGHARAPKKERDEEKNEKRDTFSLGERQQSLVNRGVGYAKNGFNRGVEAETQFLDPSKGNGHSYNRFY